MVNTTIWMLRDVKTGRWHNYGGLTEWLPPSNKGGTAWTDFYKATEFAENYNHGTASHGIQVEVVPVRAVEEVGNNRSAEILGRYAEMMNQYGGTDKPEVTAFYEANKHITEFVKLAPTAAWLWNKINPRGKG